MNASPESETLWYARRDGVVRGPFSEAQVSRYILLGRIQLGDELRTGEASWALVDQWPQVMPPELKLPPTEENEQRLMAARAAADERSGRDRRDGEGPVSAEIADRRSGRERRRPEPDALVHARRVRSAEGRAEEQRRYPRWLLAGGIAAAFILYLWAGPLPGS
jgi:hypothetical protein